MAPKSFLSALIIPFNCAARRGERCVSFPPSPPSMVFSLLSKPFSSASALLCRAWRCVRGDAGGVFPARFRSALPGNGVRGLSPPFCSSLAFVSLGDLGDSGRLDFPSSLPMRGERPDGVLRPSEPSPRSSSWPGRFPMLITLIRIKGWSEEASKRRDSLEVARAGRWGASIGRRARKGARRGLNGKKDGRRNGKNALEGRTSHERKMNGSHQLFPQFAAKVLADHYPHCLLSSLTKLANYFL